MSGAYFRAIDVTWPAAAYHACGPFTLREGQGGGRRASAATLDDPDHPVTLPEIESASAAMRDMGQTPLYMVRDGDAALDALLDQAGYEVEAETLIFASGIEDLTDIELPRVKVLDMWEPLAIMRELWIGSGTGPERQAVMERAVGPKTALLGRQNDKPAGVGFVALDGDIAMLHAVEILPFQRRQGMGRWMLRGAAHWAAARGAKTFAVLAMRESEAANALYTSLGMTVVGQYHYRTATNASDASDKI